MSLSAADLQKRHALEGAPDPFPSLSSAPAPSSSFNGANGSASSSRRQAPSAEDLNTSSESAFPSLAPSTAPPARAAPTWGSSAGKATKARTAPAPAKPTTATESLSLIVGTQTDRDGKVIPLGTTMRTVMDATKTSIEASKAMKTGVTTFFIKGASAKQTADAARQLVNRLSKTVTIKLEAPVSTLGTLIGPKGATLKAITSATGCRIDIPKRDASSPAPAPVADDDDESDDEGEKAEETVEVTITGAEASALEAQAHLQSLIGHRTSTTTTKIKTIPAAFYPYIAARKAELEGQFTGEQYQGKGAIKVNVPPSRMIKAFERMAEAMEKGEEAVEDQTAGGKKDKDMAIIVTGEREAVGQVVQQIQDLYEELNSTTTTLNISIPKRQHRFLVGANADEILKTHGCIVELPTIADPSDTVVIRGPSSALPSALGTVMTKANAITVETFDLASAHRDLAHGLALLSYLVRSGSLRAIASAHPPTKVFSPLKASIEASGAVLLEFVGEDKAAVTAAKQDVVSRAKALGKDRVEQVEVEQILHPILIGKKGAKIAQFSTQHGVEVVFPSATTPADAPEANNVFLILPPTATAAGDVKAKLAEVKAELEKLVKDVADLKTSTLDIESKWHRSIIGLNGTTLNALIGEEKVVNVRVGGGREASEEDQDRVVIRGPKADVERVEKEILRIVDEAKNDSVVNGYTVEFAVDQAHVGHLVGSAGSAINKLREDLGVRVQFDDAPSSSSAAAAPSDGKKAKKAPTGGKVTCKIVGRKEGVEEAKRRLLAQIERLADETTLTLVIPKKFHPALIGSSGKYAIRLEEKYAVKITFPRENSGQKPDEVLVRGGKKGVASAKAELLEAVEYEKETGQTVTFSIPSRAVAKVLGKSGSQINQIKAETDAIIDIDKADASTPTTNITVRGTKKAISEAKAQILEIAGTVGEETTAVVNIDPQYHRQLIGPGGSRLREIVIKAGGPTEGRQQAGLVSFPKNGNETDEVRLRGEPGLVARLQEELERIVADLKDRVIRGVSVPVLAHASKIGRGGSALMDLQKKTGATIQFPGSRQYDSFGTPENADELAEADPKSIVKVAGPLAAVEAAMAELSIIPEQAPSRTRTPQPDQQTATVAIPSKYVNAITSSDRGFIFRNLRNAGVQVDNPPAPAKTETPRPTSKPKANGTGRIDDVDEYEPSTDIDYLFEIFDRYDGGDDDEVTWTLKSRNAEALEKGKKVIEQALEQAKAADSLGVIVGLPQSVFARIVGSKGATIQRLRAESGADIIVGNNGSDMIEIVGDKDSVLHAKDAVIEIASWPDRR